jgi:hypothetical protein
MRMKGHIHDPAFWNTTAKKALVVSDRRLATIGEGSMVGINATEAGSGQEMEM